MQLLSERYEVSHPTLGAEALFRAAPASQSSLFSTVLTKNRFFSGEH